MNKVLKILKKARVIILLVFLLLALIAIRPDLGNEGASIRTVAKNSSAELAGITSPQPNAPPMSKEVIIAVNNQVVTGAEDYARLTADLVPGDTVSIKTTNAPEGTGYYTLTVKEKFITEYLNDTEEKEIVEEVFDEELNETVNVTKTIEVQKTKLIPVGTEDLGLTVFQAPTTNLRKGLDLQGGTRVLLKPETEISKEDTDTLIDNLKERLNVYGLSDIVVRGVNDLSGNQYIAVEIAGANQQEVKDLLGKQGKFEAKIGDEVIFRGGKDITYVCRSAQCSGIDPGRGCREGGAGQQCTFRFSISLTPEAAQHQADVSSGLDVITLNGEQYLEKKLDLYLDDEMVDTLNIGAELRGRAVTDIQISGAGTGVTREDAIRDSLTNMKRLQTILITGSLPVKLEMVKADSISPVLGKEFVNNSLLLGLLAICAVVGVIFVRYRSLKIALPMGITMLSEVVLLLGVAALIGWNLDIAAIAGIIIAVGTGVDDQIVIADEAQRKDKTMVLTWAQKIKRAFTIIMMAYLTTVVAMIPLMSAGAGLLKGFALTTIIGVSIGVFITRPAYAAVIEDLLKE